jgi:hypothetical protein
MANSATRERSRLWMCSVASIPNWPSGHCAPSAARWKPLSVEMIQYASAMKASVGK